MTAGSGLFADKNPQKEHLLRGSGGLAAEIADVRQDVKETFAPLASITVEEWTNPAAASATGLLGAQACTLATQTYDTSDFTGSGVLTYPRLISITTAGNTPADAPATCALTGEDIDGNVITETVNVPQTATTAYSTKVFKKLTGAAFSAGQGTDATCSIGFGAGIGLSKTPKSRAGAVAALVEISAGTVIAAPTGTITAPATNPPYGLYTPSSAPNGTNDYALYYECVP